MFSLRSLRHISTLPVAVIEGTLATAFPMLQARTFRAARIFGATFLATGVGNLEVTGCCGTLLRRSSAHKPAGIKALSDSSYLFRANSKACFASLLFGSAANQRLATASIWPHSPSIS